jgi:hypothetical protein
MEIAGRQSKVETDQHQEQIRAPPHGGLRVLAAGSREAQTRRRQGDGGHWQEMEEGMKEGQTENKDKDKNKRTRWESQRSKESRIRLLLTIIK